MSFSTMIVNDSREDLFAWKCDREDFEFGAKLVVQPSQQAVFIRDGQIAGILGPGTHTLETSNIPFLSLFTKFRFGRCFSARVYFVNHIAHKNVPWWMMDSVSCELDVGGGRTLPLDVSASGTMELAIDRNRVVDFLNSMLGTGEELSHEAVQRKFNSVMNTTLQDYLAVVLEQLHTNPFAPRKSFTQAQADLLDKLIPEFAEYGMILKKFYIDTIHMPEDDPAFQQAKLLYNRQSLSNLQYEQEIRDAEHAANLAASQSKKTLVEAETAANVTAIKAQGEATRRKYEGITSIQEHQFDTMNHFIDASAKAPAAAAPASAGMGEMSGMMGDMMKMGMGMHMAKEMGTMMKDIMGTGAEVGAAAAAPVAPAAAPAADGWTCSNGHQNPASSLFCAQCGQKKPVPQTWTCANGHVNPDSNLFCPQCGERKPAGPWTCSNGHQNAPGSLFCSTCGEPKGGR